MKKLKVLLAMFLVVSMLTACGQGSDSGSVAKSITIGSDLDLQSMDCQVATDGTSFSMQNMVISGLCSLDAAGSPVADMAETWDISTDGTVYTFHLRDAKWSNGTAVTADDFVYAWQRLVSPALASEYSFIADAVHIVNADDCASGAKPVTDLGVKAVDDKTFEVTLTQPCDFLLGLMAFPSFYPVNREFCEAQGDQYALSIDNMLFNGPYTMTGWVAGSEYTFTKNPDYYDAASIKTDEVTFKYVADTQSAVLSYENGTLDYVKLTGELVDAYKDADGYTQRLAGYMWYLSINFTKDKFTQGSDLLKALSLSIDRDVIVNNVLKDGSVAAKGIIPTGFATGPDGKDYRDTADTICSYDVTAAGEFYKLAVVANGGDYSIELLYEDTEASKAVAEQIQSMWQSACPGLTVTLNSKPKKTRLDLMQHQDYEIALTRWGPDYADPETYMDLFLSTSLSNNNGRYTSSAYDALVNGADVNTNSEERWQQYKDAEKILVGDDIGVIPVYQSGGACLINPKVSNMQFHAASIDVYRYMSKAA